MPTRTLTHWLMTVVSLILFTASARASPEGKPPTVEAVLTLTGHTKGVFHVAFSPDGKRLATAGKDITARLWDATTGTEMLRFKGHTGSVYSVAFSPDGKYLATASEDQTVRVWDVKTGNTQFTCSGHSSDVYHVVFSPDGKRLASCGSDNKVILWDATNGKVLHKLDGHTNRVVTVSFSPDGLRLASACATNANGNDEQGGEVKIWDVATGQEYLSMPAATKGVLTIAFSPDGKRLAGACLGKKVKIWEAANGQEALSLEGHTLDVYHVVFSPDGRFLASCSAKWNKEQPGEIKLWDLATAKELASFVGHTTTIWSLAFSPDGKRLASASGLWNKDQAGEAKVWNLAPVLKTVEQTPPALDAKQLEALWADLSGKDAVKAYRAVWGLSSAPKAALPYLNEHAKASPINPAIARIPKLIEELDDGSFDVREKASEELEKLGRAAQPALTKAKESPSPEVRRRVNLLLEKKSEPPVPTAEELRTWRTLEVLQHIGTAETKPLLQRLAKEAAGTPQGHEAATILERLSAKKP